MTSGPTNKKRKIPWMLLGVVALVAIIVANVLMWRGSLDAQSRVDDLKAEAAQVNQQVSQGVPLPPTDLEAELEQAEDDLAEALQVFPSNINGNDVIDFIIAVAAECSVDLVPLVSDGESADSDGQSVVIFRYHGTVSGTIYHTSSFLTKLQTGRYQTLVLTECNVKRILTIDNPASGDSVLVTVDFSIAIYVSLDSEDEDTVS